MENSEVRGSDDVDIGPLPDEDPRAHGLRTGVEGLRDLVARLLGDEGCPWDREQTLETLRPYLVEETYEVLEAMDDPAAHAEELGDLLFQIVFQSALREEQGEFDLDAVADGILRKLIRRHPHVFGTPEQRAARLDRETIRRQWAAIKRAEGRKAPDRHRDLEAIPRDLPALSRAWRLQDKAARLGFDWPDIEGALAKFSEEWAEFEEARAGDSRAALLDEFGDLLFVLVRIGQKLGLEPEDALRRANAKFERRFGHVLQRSAETGVDPSRAGLEQLEAWWQEAKSHEREPQE